MNERSLLIVGCGDLGQRVSQALHPLGWMIDGVRRNPPSASADVRWSAADYAAQGSLSFAATLQPAYVLATFTPTSRDIEGYQRGYTQAAKNLLAGLGEHRPRHLIMVSSTRVYAEASGGWIDETAPLTATDPRAEAIIDSENIFLSSVHRATVVRAGGIYGNPKSRLLDRVLRGSLSPAQPLRYTNRIHRDDCAGFLVHLLELAQAGESLEPIYNAVDNLPAPAHDVDRWLAEAMCIATPLPDAPPHSPPATHKRCRNDALHSSGYSLRYPDYRVGYGELIANRR